jgi:hypothetical protein
LTSSGSIIYITAIISLILIITLNTNASTSVPKSTQLLPFTSSKSGDDFKKRSVESVFNNKNKAQVAALHLACQGN